MQATSVDITDRPKRQVEVMKSCTVYLPIKNPSVLPSDELRSEYFNECLSSLIDCIPLLIANGVQSVKSVNVNIVDPPQHVVDLLVPHNFLVSSRLFFFLRLEIEGCPDIGYFRENNPDLVDCEDSAYEDAILPIEVQARLDCILQITEIAFPGVISVERQLYFSGDDLVSYSDKKTAFYEICNCDWPPLQILGLIDVDIWFKKHGFGETRKANTRLQRTLASYLCALAMGWSNEGEALFRCMQGLEAFYTTGTGDLRNQLSERIKLFLGPWGSRRNEIGRLYDSRSKFVHGGGLIHFPLPPYGDVEEEEFDGLHDSTLFSVRLLTSTIQKCVEDDLHDVVWTYDVNLVRNSND